MAETAHYASFIVRLWHETAVETTGQEEPHWMGELESIQTGRAWQFQGLEPLLPLLAAQLAGDTPAFPGTQEQPG
jgi:hypothetical protein